MTPCRLILALILSWSCLAGCSRRTAPPTPASAPSPAATSAATTKTPVAEVPAKARAKADVASQLAKAETTLAAGNLVGGVVLLDQLLQADPDNRRALGLLAKYAQLLGQQLPRPQNTPLLLRSAEALRRLRERKVELTPEEKVLAPVILFNEACTHAVSGEFGRAIGSLVEALDSGFLDVDQLDADHELDSLRKLPQFQDLQRKAERRKVEALLAASKPYSFDFRLTDLDGKPVALADVKGEITIVDFWGTWCLPCRKQIPHLVELARIYQEKGLRVVGLACEPEPLEAARKTVRAFVNSHGIHYPCLLASDETTDKVSGFQGYPTTLFLDRAGKVRLRMTGYQSMLTLETIVNLLLADGKPAEKGKAATK